MAQFVILVMDFSRYYKVLFYLSIIPRYLILSIFAKKYGVEDEDEVIMMFLFEEDRRKMEERKTDLYSMWKLRKRKQRELNTTQNAPLPK